MNLGGWTGTPEELNGALARTGATYRVPTTPQAAGGGDWSPGQALNQPGGMTPGPVVPPAVSAPPPATGAAPAAGAASAFGGADIANMAGSLMGQGAAPAPTTASGMDPYAQQEAIEAQKEAERKEKMGKIVSVVGAFFTGGASLAAGAGAAAAAQG